jgi:PAS domain S-box-containing protein
VTKGAACIAAATQTDFKELLQAAPDPVVITEGGRIILVNREAELNFGYTQQELLGSSIELLMPERFRSGHVKHREAYERRPKTRPMGAGVELFARRKDGTEFPVEISLSPTESHGRTVVISIIRDITERKRAQKQIAELLATVNHILDGMSEPVLVIDQEGRVTRANLAAVRLLGGAARDLVGQRAHDVLRWEDEGGRLLDEDEYAYQRAFSTAASVTTNHRYLRRSDNTRVPVAVSAAPVMDAERGVQVAVEIIRDVTREREAEDLKDRIISLVSHELRTPIGHIKGFASSLLEADVTWDEATQQDFIAEIDREADRLAALVTDLLDMSKIESGRDFLERSWRQPAVILAQALRSVDRLTARHQAVVELDPDLPNVFVDGTQLERVIGNLVENAAKYTDPGLEIHVRVRRDGQNLEFCVADRGPGIPAEYRERIFERFFRIKGGPAPKPGTGLGLPICRGIVEAHGGRLWFEERPGGGSRFRFTIPIRPPSDD